jgi:hypothetical protein
MSSQVPVSILPHSPPAALLAPLYRGRHKAISGPRCVLIGFTLSTYPPRRVPLCRLPPTGHWTLTQSIHMSRRASKTRVLLKWDSLLKLYYERLPPYSPHPSSLLAYNRCMLCIKQCNSDYAKLIDWEVNNLGLVSLNTIYEWMTEND